MARYTLPRIKVSDVAPFSTSKLTASCSDHGSCPSLTSSINEDRDQEADYSQLSIPRTTLSHSGSVPNLFVLERRKSDNVKSKTLGRFRRHHNYSYIKKIRSLHTVNTVQELIKGLKSIDVNNVDESGDAVLHALVKRSFYKKDDLKRKLTLLTSLLVHSNVDVNQKAAHGMTALHFAIQASDYKSAEILLAFGADVNAIDDYEITPFDLIDGGSATQILNCDETFSKQGKQLCDLLKSAGGVRGRFLQKHTILPVVQLSQIESKDISMKRKHYFELEQNIEQRFSAVPFSNSFKEAIPQTLSMLEELQMYKQQNGSRILCLDGGGIRGLVQIEILIHLEQQTGRKVTELFDWMIGTSTGAIVVLGLVYAKKSLQELRQLYFRLKEEVFAKSFGFGCNTDALERTLKLELGEEMCMNDVDYPRVLIAAVKKEYINIKLHFFNNCFDDDYSTKPIWYVARCSSAAPILFNEHDNYVDGGMLANNPSESGLTKIQMFYRTRGEKLPISLLVSVGSGKSPVKKLGSTDAQDRLFLGSRSKNLLTMLANAIGDSEIIAENCECRCKEQGITYFRLNPRLKELVSSDEKDTATLIDMMIQARTEMNHYLRQQTDALVCTLHRLSQIRFSN